MYVAGILNEVETVKAGYVGQRIVYEEEQQFAGYNSQRDSYGMVHTVFQDRFSRCFPGVFPE